MCLLLLLCFWGDFTYTAPEGSWLDYARSRALSENRILIVEHTGPKGDYRVNGGGRQLIYDASGQFLYEIAVAKNAWMLLCGVNNDEDTYLYQRQNDTSFHIWNPSYGDHLITIAGKEPVAVGTLQNVTMVSDGQRIVFLSKKTKMNGLDMVQDGFQLELIELKNAPVQSLFGTVDLPANLYLDTSLKVNDAKLSGTRVIFSNILSNTFWLIDLENLGPDGQMTEVSTTYQPMFFTLEHDFIVYRGNYRGEWAFCLQKIGEAQPLFVATEADKEKPGYKELHDLWTSLGRGNVYLEEGILYYQKKDRMIAYDTVNNLLNHYSAPMTADPIGDVTKGREITCDSATFRIHNKASMISQYRINRPELIFQLQVNNFKKPL